MRDDHTTLLPRAQWPPVAIALCEHLAADLAEMTERAVNAEADRNAYRELAQQGIHALHFMTAERDRLRRRVSQLVKEVRDWRELVETAA